MLSILPASPGFASDFVIQISVDGLGASYLQNLIGLGQAPNFSRFQTEGAWTNNARTDYDYTVTLPNHTSMLTGRPVLDQFSVSGSGHSWTDNGEPGPVTLHDRHGTYVSSTFDVAHDFGLSTGLYVTKSKFVLYNQSYDATTGALDVTGLDHGRDKIDIYSNLPGDSPSMLNSFLLNMGASPSRYNFLHFHDADSAGHGIGWGSAAYHDAIKAVDGYLGGIFNLISTNPLLNGHTTIILSADHGGNGFDHSIPTDPLDYTIPFYVWGAGVKAGADLYSLNSNTRLNPGADRPDYSVTDLPPIRNGDGGNLALSLLGLPALSGSTINQAQNLAVPEPGSLVLFAFGFLATAARRGLVRAKQP